LMLVATSPATMQRPWITFAQAPWPQRLEILQGLSYRFGIYAALNFIDEPAWLALMFC